MNRIFGYFFFWQCLSALALVTVGALFLYRSEGMIRAKQASEREVLLQTQLGLLKSALNRKFNEARDEVSRVRQERRAIEPRLKNPDLERVLLQPRSFLFAVGVTGPEGLSVELMQDSLRSNLDHDFTVQLRKSWESRTENSAFVFVRLETPVLNTNAVLVGFPLEAQAIGAAKPQVFEYGVFRSEWLFSFCHDHPEMVYILDAAGQRVCHSLRQGGETVLSKDQIFEAKDKGQVVVEDAMGVKRRAVVRPISELGFWLVAEQSEDRIVGWAQIFGTVPLPYFAVWAGLTVFLFFSIGAIAARWDLARWEREKTASKAVEMGRGEPQSDGLGFELKEFSKMQHEIQDLEKALLELEGLQALSVEYQQKILSLKNRDAFEKSWVQVTLDFLWKHHVVAAWASRDQLGTIDQALPAEIENSLGLKQRLGKALNLEVQEQTKDLIRIFPLYVEENLLGVFAVKQDGLDAAAPEKVHQVSQVLRLVSWAFGSTHV